VTEVVRRVCAGQGVPLSCVDFSRLTPLDYSLDGQRFAWDGTEYRLGLLGPHQLHNTCTVLETVEALRERGWRIPEEAVAKGLDTVKWPARLEILGTAPLFLLDGGHNPQCAEALCASLDKLLPGQKVVFLLGVLADKDYPQIMSMVQPYAQEFFCLTPFSDRALDAKKLSAFLRGKGAKARAVPDVKRGIRAAIRAAGPDGAVVSFGSLYLAGHVRGVYQELFGK